jgi:hypothetical protein
VPLRKAVVAGPTETTSATDATAPGSMWAKMSVVRSLEWPRVSDSRNRSARPARNRLANVCRNECGPPVGANDRRASPFQTVRL